MQNAQEVLSIRQHDGAAEHHPMHYSAMINALPLPVCLINYCGLVVFSNAAFQTLRSASHHFYESGTLGLRARGAERQLTSALNALQSGTKVSADIYISANKFGDAPTEILWMRLQILPANDAVMVSVYAPNITALDGSGLTERLQNLFDLSSAEAATALCLSGGLSASAISAKRGVSLPTVRTQLSALRQKMGVKTSMEAVVQITKLSLPL